ncbi:acyl carrier protein [Streptomyces sp. LP11]|uniref:Acyl carrier protein n=1 Tax=Streptomyces pyxinicus TaxID=2970331 RepID=A0ABT2B705_9ACTN|nr:acyl carrier protein [Streptomyces sp. LP11]MCS0603723.1 acyl carrier protein [Streptomyces sp. LP11]
MKDQPSGDPPPDDVLAELRAFFGQVFPGIDLGADDDYFRQGNADSLFALELVTFVEQHFRVGIDVEDLDLDNFRTLGRTTAFVHRKRAGAAVERRPGGPGND